MTFYTLAVNSVFVFLIAGGFLFSRGGADGGVLLNLLFYIIVTPVISLTLTKLMFMSENGMIVQDAATRAYGAKGDDIVAMNHAAIERGFTDAKEIPIPAHWASQRGDFVSFYATGRDPEVVEYVNRIQIPADLQKGDDLPVSAFAGYEDGVIDILTWPLDHSHNGITAENVAERFGVTREMQDEFSANSQHKYGVAAAAGKFDEEIVPVMVKVKKEMVEFKVDEQPRPDSTAEKLANLKPAFKRDGGTVTAGNASGINDGAAALVIMSAEKAKELGVKPLAKIVTGASAGVDPSIMGIGPVYATRKALKKANLELKDIDLIEANEAFAAQSVAVANELGFDMDKVNVNGGAVALGHPIGASGCRILVTLLYEMKRRNAKYGLATLCVGGGMGVATIVEGM